MFCWLFRVQKCFISRIFRENRFLDEKRDFLLEMRSWMPSGWMVSLSALHHSTACYKLNEEPGAASCAEPALVAARQSFSPSHYSVIKQVDMSVIKMAEGFY